MLASGAQADTPDRLEEESTDLFELRWLGLAARAPRRHPLLVAIVLVLAFPAALGAIKVLPHNYHSEVRIVELHLATMSFLVNPRRTPYSMGEEGKPLSHASAELVLRWDNMAALIKQYRLLENWREHRAPLLKLKDDLLEALRGPLDQEQEFVGMVKLLEKRFKLSVEEGIFTLGIDWPDPQMAFLLAESAQRMFLEARRAEEVNAVAETFSILESRAAEAEARMDQTLERIQQIKAAKKAGMRPATLRSVQAEGKWRDLPDPTLSRLRMMVIAKRKAIAEMEDSRRKRVAELTSLLVDEKTTYAENHPLVQKTLQEMAALSGDSPGIETLRSEEQKLLQQFVNLGGKDADLSADPTIRPWTDEHESDDPSLDFTKAKLQLQLAEYSDMRQRADTAGAELEAAKAAFKYHYSVLDPPELPRVAGPVSRMLGGAVAALLLALFAAVALDLMRGRLLEPWQVEKELRIPVLAEVKAP